MPKHIIDGSAVAATLVIHGPGKMSAKGRNDIALWLEGQAYKLKRDGKLYTDGRFRSQFRYLPKKS